MEHKLNICFNKCDQFSKMHDFARAFGALCWNLSKVGGITISSGLGSRV